MAAWQSPELVIYVGVVEFAQVSYSSRTIRVTIVFASISIDASFLSMTIQNQVFALILAEKNEARETLHAAG